MLFKGIHEDSGRNVSINMDLPAPFHLPESIVSLCRASESTSSESLPEVAKHIVTSVVDAEVQSRSNDEKVIWRYGQAIAKFMGNSGFREKLSISEKDVLELDHLDEQYDPEQVLSFQLMHRSQLCSKLCQEDRVYFEKIHDPPYFIGDFNKARPTGEMDLAVTVMLRDLVWVDSEFFFAGPTYYWHDQYLSEIVIRKEGRRATLERLLYQQSVPGLDVVYGDVVSYHAGESPEVELLALSEVSRASNNARIAGPDRLIVREGMGVVFETPVLMAYKRPFLTRIYGFVIAFKDDTRDDADPRYPVHIKIRVHLSKENIPTWLLSESRLKGSDLLQTNLELTISESYLVGVFSIWPPCLFQGTCVPGPSEEHINDRIVVGHLQILRRVEADKEGSSVHTSDSDSDKCEDEQGIEKCASGGCGDASSELAPHGAGGDSPVLPIIKMFSGGAFIDVYRVKPMTADVAFAYLGRMQEFTHADRPNVHLKTLLHSFEQFAKEKTSKRIKSIQNQRTFRPPVPGRAVMLLLKTLPGANVRQISLSNKTMVVTIGEPSFLDSMFSRKMSEFDFRSEGFGMVRLLGPVHFKWEMCLSEDGCGPVEGRMSVTVGGWTELDRFNIEAIKQSSEAGHGARAAKRENPSKASGRASKTEKIAPAKVNNGRQVGL
jgi:hypothetical protein